MPSFLLSTRWISAHRGYFFGIRPVMMPIPITVLSVCLPFFPTVPTSYGFDGTNYGGAALTLGYGINGTWAAMARINNISFYEDLSHVLRLVYYQGTNNTQMVRDKFITNPQDTIGSMTYMTTADKAVEFNFDSTYKIYDNLTMHVELGYIRMDQDKELWRSVGYEANKNNFKYTLSFQYMF